MESLCKLIDSYVTLPIKTFFPIKLDRTPVGMTSCLYLINRPIIGLKIDLSSTPLKIGNFGNLNFLSVAGSYRLGYLIETPSINTYITDLYLFVGNKDAKLKKVKSTEVIYSDNSIHLIRNKLINSYMLLPVCNLDFPKVQRLKMEISDV